MKWESETVGQFAERVDKWHRWFAWHPVHTSEGKRHWLEYVERRADVIYSVFLGLDWTWQYRAAATAGTEAKQEDDRA